MAIYGVDVSHWQGRIDYEKFANEEAVYNDFLVAKATQGRKFQDAHISYNMDMCREYSILHGMYHYLVGDVDVKEQVDNFLNSYHTFGDRETIIALDVEDFSITNKHYKDVTLMVETFCGEVVEDCGVYPIIYVSKCFMKPDMFSDIGKLCAGWIAAWGNKRPARRDLNCTIWQKSSAGVVAGIGGRVDLDVAYVTKENWLKLAGLK